MNKDDDFFNLLERENIKYTVMLDETITVNEDLILTGRSSLSTLPDRLKVEGILNLNWNTSIRSLSTTYLFIEKSMLLTGCTFLERLPDDLRVGENLSLMGCTKVRKLPSNLRIGGNIFLNGCKLHYFDPKTLYVGGKIHGPYEIIENSVRFICG